MWWGSCGRVWRVWLVWWRVARGLSVVGRCLFFLFLVVRCLSLSSFFVTLVVSVCFSVELGNEHKIQKIKNEIKFYRGFLRGCSHSVFHFLLFHFACRFSLRFGFVGLDFLIFFSHVDFSHFFMS